MRRNFEIKARSPKLVVVSSFQCLLVAVSVLLHWLLLSVANGLPCYIAFSVTYTCEYVHALCVQSIQVLRGVSAGSGVAATHNSTSITIPPVVCCSGVAAVSYNTKLRCISISLEISFARIGYNIVSRSIAVYQQAITVSLKGGLFTVACDVFLHVA